MEENASKESKEIIKVDYLSLHQDSRFNLDTWSGKKKKNNFSSFGHSLHIRSKTVWLKENVQCQGN